MQYRSADLNGPVGYADFGGRGPSLVLVHGLAGAHINWMAVGPKLAETYHVLALDLVGFGRTPLAGREATVETNLDVLTRFVEEIAGGPSLVVGHSMGGLLTLLLAATRPDLVTAAALVSAASPPGDKTHPMPEEEENLLTLLLDDVEGGAAVAHAHVASVGPQAIVERAFAYMCARPVDQLVLDAHIALEQDRIQTTESTLAYLQAFKSLRGRGDDFETFDAAINAVTAPVLIVHGLQDPVVPADNMLRAARLRADWDAVWLDGVGHNVQMEAPEEFLAALEPFLAAHAAPVTA
jgi:pimeloyl-ACP methyl ester carboxylesterase